MTKEESDRWWRIYGHQFFCNPPVDPTFEDLYQAVWRRLFDEGAVLKHVQLVPSPRADVQQGGKDD